MMIWGYIHVMIWGHVYCTCDDMGVRTCKAVQCTVDCTLLKNKLLLVTFILDAPDKEIQVQIPYRNPMWSSLG